MMRFCLLWLLACSGLAHAQPFTSPDDTELAQIASLIYRNECAGKPENLVVWNQGEAFPSLGIGHFIWYPEGYKGPFKESFPALLEFMQLRHVSVPLILKQQRGAPWPDRAHFEHAAKNTPEIETIRIFLLDTMPEQAQFMRERFAKAVAQVLRSAPVEIQSRLQQRYQRVAAAPLGLYALMDYVNFKGEGIEVSERYQGFGWGLLQVLEAMRDDGNAIESFAEAATFVLERRVANAPPERNESRWLPGWRNRIATYVSEQRKFTARHTTTR